MQKKFLNFVKRIFCIGFAIADVMGDGDESIEEAVAARRERLRALKAAQQLLNTPDDDGETTREDEDKEAEFVPGNLFICFFPLSVLLHFCDTLVLYPNQL